MHHTLDFFLRWALALITFSKLLAPAADSYSWLLDVCAVQVKSCRRTHATDVYGRAVLSIS